MNATRRGVVRLGLALGGCSIGSSLLLSNSMAAQAAKAAPKSMAEWMDKWTGVRARDPVGGLYVYRFREPMWALLKPIGWAPNDRDSKLRPVEVPSGFVTDFASIPRAFYSFLRPDGEYAYPAIVHDFLYWTQNETRANSDEIFRLMMLEFKVGPKTATTIFNAVRQFGQSAWDGNARLKASGERRVLLKLPDDPRITWEEWKKKENVFASGGPR